MFSVGVLLIFNWGVYGTIAGQVLSSLIIFSVLWYYWRAVRRDLRSTSLDQSGAESQ